MYKKCIECSNEFETNSNRKVLCDSCQIKNSKIEVICEKCGNKRLIRKYQKDTKLCKKCINIGRKHSEETNKKNSERNKGELNGFYNKTHSVETKQKIGKYKRSDRQKEQARNSLKEVTNTRPIKDIWIEKYGNEIAQQKENNRREKLRIKNSGELNPMYGKPSPSGSGNGWSGWFNNYYFRSLLELSYLKYLIDNNIKFETGEQKKYSISYLIDGIQHNYFCDYYLIDDDIFIEIKPKALLNTKINSIKFNNAKQKFEDRFVILTEDNIIKLTDNEILDMYNSQQLKWIDRYQKKFEERFLNASSDNN